MKNKSTTVLLTILLIIVWGTIGYKIYSNGNVEIGNISQGYPVQFTPPEVREDESYSLCLEYSDPFFSAKESLNKEKKNVKLKPVKTDFDWNRVRYKGCIYSKKSLMGILEVDGKLGFVRRGSKHEGLDIKNMNRDSIKLEIDGDNRWVKIVAKN